VKFRYQALDLGGSSLTGELEAASQSAAYEQLLARELKPFRLEPVARKTVAARPRRATSSDRAVLVRELAVMLGGGVTLSEAVGSLADAHASDAMGQALQKLLVALKGGLSFGDALPNSGLELPSYAVQLARAGELTGRLAPALLRAAEQMEYDVAIRQEIRTALIYPSVLVTAGIAAVLIIFVFVVPRFANIVRNPRADVPEISRIVIETGVFMRDHQGLVLLALIAIAATIWSVLRSGEARQKLTSLVASWPIVGQWFVESTCARWASMMGALLDSRVPLVRALELARESVRLPSMRSGLERAAEDVRAGKRLADGLESHGVLPSLAISMLKAGERSGELPAMLGTLSQLYQQAGRNRMKQFLALLEPAAILLIGLVIGIIMVAVILGITSLSNIRI
jgi:general secretion pathway protein F